MQVQITGINENTKKQYYWHEEVNEFFEQKITVWQLSFGEKIKLLHVIYCSLPDNVGKF